VISDLFVVFTVPSNKTAVKPGIVLKIRSIIVEEMGCNYTFQVRDQICTSFTICGLTLILHLLMFEGFLTFTLWLHLLVKLLTSSFPVLLSSHLI
jgi:uncharacterized protein (DUF983 family)